MRPFSRLLVQTIHHAPFRPSWRQAHPSLVSRCSPLIRRSPRAAVLLAVSSVGAGIVTFSKPEIHCDSRHTEVEPISEDPLPPPSSSVSFYQLTFGTVAGICTGIFIKKGVKTVAWFLGGVFVLLQYLASKSLIRVDWARIGTRFERLFYIRDMNGIREPPTLGSLWGWLVDFLTADFQPRASFVAGLALGLRMG